MRISDWISYVCSSDLGRLCIIYAFCIQRQPESQIHSFQSWFPMRKGFMKNTAKIIFPLLILFLQGGGNNPQHNQSRREGHTELVQGTVVSSPGKQLAAIMALPPT